MNINALTTPQRISAISILVAIFAAFLPWVSFLGITVAGIEGDGVITLLLAVAGGALLSITTDLFGKSKNPGKASQITLVVLAGLTTLVGIIDTTRHRTILLRPIP